MFGARRLDRLLKHRLVKLEPDFPDMAGLLITQQIACAANVEIVAGKLEARAERIQARKHLQALFGGFGDGPVGRRRQIGISARLCPAHAAAQLIELCEDRKSTRPKSSN